MDCSNKVKRIIVVEQLIPKRIYNGLIQHGKTQSFLLFWLLKHKFRLALNSKRFTITSKMKYNPPGRACKSLSDLPLQPHSPSIPFCLKTHKSSTSIYGFFLTPVMVFYITAPSGWNTLLALLLAFLFIL